MQLRVMIFEPPCKLRFDGGSKDITRNNCTRAEWDIRRILILLYTKSIFPPHCRSRTSGEVPRGHRCLKRREEKGRGREVRRKGGREGEGGGGRGEGGKEKGRERGEGGGGR